jgi:hypothetical protein
VITELQEIFAEIGLVYGDLKPGRIKAVSALVDRGLQVCLDARLQFPPEGP